MVYTLNNHQPGALFSLLILGSHFNDLQVHGFTTRPGLVLKSIATGTKKALVGPSTHPNYSESHSDVWGMVYLYLHEKNHRTIEVN